MNIASKFKSARSNNPLIKRFFGASLALSVALFAATPSAHAATISVTASGEHYDLSTIIGTFADLAPVFSQQVWFGDDELARLFAVAVGDGLGLQPMFDDRFSPGFVTSTQPNVTNYYAFDTLRADWVGLIAPNTTDFVYVIATPTQIIDDVLINDVPLPFGGPLLLMSLLGVAGMSRRKRISSKPKNLKEC